MSTTEFVTTIQTVIIIENRVVNPVIPLGKGCCLGSIGGYAVVIPLGFLGRIEEDKSF
jgi:hypothetical protein